MNDKETVFTEEVQKGPPPEAEKEKHAQQPTLAEFFRSHQPECPPQRVTVALQVMSILKCSHRPAVDGEDWKADSLHAEEERLLEAACKTITQYLESN